MNNPKNFTFVAPDFGKNPITFFKEVSTELKKVSWPTKEETIKLTLVVISVSALVAVYVGGLDFIFTKIIEYILNRK